ncbi:hypothetical protein ACFZDG_27140 [Kitasatospora xanthocidica]|uniref:hypothetical protein n=1 Tax=Kitasatospora xanthocidica TaxID=83382 RepID=UPI0036EA68BE
MSLDAFENDSLPPLLRRPDEVPDPAPVTQLRGFRKTLLDNPVNSLDEAAATVVTGGAVDPVLLRKLVEAAGETADAGLLMAKPVVGGTLYAIPPHRRFTDLDVLPDFLNQRWVHKLHTAMDDNQENNAPVVYRTFIDEASGQPRALFVVRVANRQALADAVTESMRQTYGAQGQRNVYTESVLQHGIKEPLTLFLVRVVYDDDVEETYTVAGDGNSRLVSMWLARTGGNIDEAAAACVAAVIGPVDRSGPRRPADQRSARAKVTEMAARVRRGLAEKVLTEATRREGHTLTFPAIVVVGAVTEDGTPLPDLVAARDDLVANLHVHVTPWDEGAQNTQGMQRVYRHALREYLVDADTYKVLLGEVGPGTMHKLLGLPPHRLWSVALHQQCMLAGQAERMNRLLKQEFGIGRADRQKVSERIASMALSAYRSSPAIDQYTRALGNGGTITDTVWKRNWTLTRGTDALKVLDDILERALLDETNAVAELTVLGGTAAIVSGLITRDRGSKLAAARELRTAPLRHTPNALLALLAGTQGGLRMLHSIAYAHVAADPSILPKQFHTAEREIDGAVVRDGEPVVDKAGAVVSIDYEWDLVYAASPVEAEASIAELKKKLDGKTGSGNTTETEDARQRRILQNSIRAASRAAFTLAKMTQTHARGREVFGLVTSVDALRVQLGSITETLIKFGPVADVMPDPEDEVEYEDEDGDGA